MKAAVTFLALFALVSPLAGVETWSILDPDPTSHWDQAMGVDCGGSSNATVDKTLSSRIFRDGTLKNFTTSSYNCVTLTWGPDTVPPPAGGFGAGQGQLKVFIYGVNYGTATPLVTGTFTFDPTP